MALPQANNKGTLVPGQKISVNSYTVQVERYLSQGGFAYVYLVRTPTPVYGTTHHVLKRIAVPNESMLTEVKKEVDIMRILKGHPNIVHLIDAAWNKTSNGVYEVFILMEYCPGGGIIDMMNRRLRERLTEADILQIFVDVCEGVASMHNLRPALLHRDLKVENILQSSDVLYKLCDFGSASPVAPRLPANTQEIRTLEADLNRHTTLQYRAPEMVDPYLRRPIDEKSDVWALGVLLYKLCYYTTPFEEHGPLAILNVQYKIPPYPVYSSQMNSLIASMLREHGAQRPTVFETLNIVHRMRGTKSKFNYNVPSRSQLVSQLAIDRAPATSAALDGLISYRTSTASIPQAPPVNADKNAGVQAREKVLEAIAPLRRGRPTPISLHHATTGPSSPAKEKVEHKPSEFEFKDAEDESWKAARGAVRGHRSGLASPTRWPPPAASLDDAWSVARGSGTGSDKAKDRDRRRTVQGSSLGGFGDSFEAKLDLPSISTVAASKSSSPWSSPQPSTKPLAPIQRPSEISSRIRVPNKPKDAFDGLGLPSDRSPVPTLGDVQKARTGTSAGGSGPESSSANLTVPGRGTTYTSAGSSPRPSPSPRLSSKGPSPAPSTSTSWRASLSPLPQAQSNAPKVDLTAEQRFPAFEDLDRALLPSTAGPPPPASTLLPSHEKKGSLSTPSVLSPKPSYSAFTGLSSPRTGRKLTQTLGRGGGVHSEQATGSAPLESRDARTPKRERTGSRLPELSPSRIPRLPSRAMPPKRQASLTLTPPATKGFKSSEPPSPAQIMGRPEPQDWLTGPEDDPMSGTTTKPVLKESPGKRSSVIVERAPHIPSPQEAVAVSDKRPSPPPSPTPASKTTPSWIMTTKQINADTGGGRSPLQPRPKTGMGPTAPRVSAPPPADSWLPTHRRRDTTSTTSSEDGPEEATGYGPPRHTATRESQRVEVKKTDGASAGGRRRSKSRGRQGSVHELVDLWGGKDGRPKSSGAGSGPSFGSKPVSQDPEELGSPSKLLFPPVDQSPKPRSASPSPLISPSISTDSTSAKYDLSSTARNTPRHRKQSTNGRDTGPSPSIPPGAATARPRPQSMFLNSPTTAAVKFPIPSPVDGGSTNLDVPSPDTRSQRMRRTSISDMVQRYEAMGGGGSAAPSPASRQPNSSTQLGVSSIARSTTTHVSPPSGSAVPSLASRQPNTSTQLGVSSLSRSTTTQVSSSSRRNQLGAVGLPGLATDPSKKPLAGIGVSDKPRAEHASPIGLPGLAIERKSSYSGRRSPIKSSATGGVGGGTSGGEGGLDAPVRPIPKRSFSPAPPATSDDVQSPAPEKPYQGVGRLIDEWQRKTADAGDTPRSPVSRRRGGGGTGTSAAASPRRAGVIAGRGAQD